MSLDNSTFTPQVKYEKCTNDKAVLIANTAKLVVERNGNRQYGLFVNQSSTAITLILGDITGATIGKGIPLLPYGSYTIGRENLYTGKVSAIASVAAELSFVECSL